MADCLSQALGSGFLVLLLSPGLGFAAPPPDEAAAGSTGVEAMEGHVAPHFGPVSTQWGDSLYLSEQVLRQMVEGVEETHLPGPPLPIDPTFDPATIRPATLPTLSPTLLEADVVPVEPAAASDLQVFRKHLLSEVPAGFNSLVSEPSVATHGDVVFQAGNWYTALSIDGGQSFRFNNPAAGPFGSSNSFCCDQVALYEPSRNAIFLLQQYIPNAAGVGVQRINVDRGADGVFDCAYDFKPSHFGLGSGLWLDFPDLAYGSNYLYHTTNVYRASDRGFTNTLIARFPLDQIATCSSIDYRYFTVSDRGSFRATHGAGQTMYWAAHNSNASLRIYRWGEASSTIFFDDRGIGGWNADGYTCPGPGGRDFCGRADSRILGAFLANGVLGFMWNAGRGGFFPYPHVQVARFRESDRALVEQTQIWSNAEAWQYPSVGVNARGHLGGTILHGGGAYTPICSAWIADDFNGGILAPLENLEIVRSSFGPSDSVGGDYLTSRPHFPNSNTWVGTCYSLQTGGSNTDARSHYVWFGRQRDAVSQTTCQSGARTLCLVGGRFKVEVDWRTSSGSTGVGTAIPNSDATGLFWFFDQANIELIVKVLDGRTLNGHYWLFYGALSDVEYWIRATDTQTGVSKTYHNPPGSICGKADTSAF